MATKTDVVGEPQKAAGSGVCDLNAEYDPQVITGQRFCISAILARFSLTVSAFHEACYDVRCDSGECDGLGSLWNAVRNPQHEHNFLAHLRLLESTHLMVISL
jgi:hypothetical protein